MKYLTLEEILFMHHRILVELQPDNETFGIVSPGSLEAAVARPMQTVFGNDAYPTAYSKAAALVESLISNHCFQDGNKRIGISAGIIFMMNNGFVLAATDDDVYDAAFNASKGEWKFDDLKDWFENHFVL